VKLNTVALFILFLLLLTFGCVPAEPQGEISPLVWSNFSSPLSAKIKAPQSGSVNVCGMLMLMNPAIIAPQEDGLYLVPIDINSARETTIVVPVVNPATAFQAEVDEVTGYFCFKDIPVGLYALIAMTDNGTQISVRNFETGQAIILNVKQENLGKNIDLGIVRLP
jgi:hypothetical protein